MSEDQNTLFLKIGTGFGLPETYVKQSFLEAYGYTVLNFNQNNMAVSPHHVHAIEGMTLYIPENEVEDALALLESIGEDDTITRMPTRILYLFLFLLSNYAIILSFIDVPYSDYSLVFFTGIVSLLSFMGNVPGRAIGFFASSSAQLRSILHERKNNNQILPKNIKSL